MLSALKLVSRLVLLTVVAVAPAGDAFALPTNGLVGLWVADGDATDAIGNNDGSLTNGASFATGQFGQAFSLDGVDDRITLAPDAYDSLNGGDLTISAWINPSVTGGQTITWFEGAWFMGLNPDMNLETAFGPAGLTGSMVISTNDWMHVAVTLASDGAIALYVNGAQDGTGDISGGTWNANGSGSHFGGQVGARAHFNGLIDEVAIYDRVLTPEEIADGWNVSTVPEPSTGLLLALGLGGIAWRQRRAKH